MPVIQEISEALDTMPDQSNRERAQWLGLQRADVKLVELIARKYGLRTDVSVDGSVSVRLR